jgi:hypothetical protein
MPRKVSLGAFELGDRSGVQYALQSTLSLIHTRNLS